ncbi:hypothetical protein DDZ18_06490 [Marinicauda salina]|uniref:DUF2066 domain-containing protein n=1 Tax=Marinicauda salina TaxID=2135793 RepID=A0A2U2BTJ9_9PROT|nr:DUF2066 domain-containing protein [Marinicauda salina]PWE17329.1 hypothetical protein DDZ18_06490 [Marinicauda salina]
MDRPLVQAFRDTLAALGAALAFAGAALAADPFTVVGVEVDAEADTATQAQRLALAQGQALGAQRLIERLTLPEDRLAAAMPTIDPDRAAELLAGLQISDEQRSATRYLASLTLEFDDGAVREHLEGYGVPYVEAQSRPVLVLPVLDRDGETTLWEGPWYETWLTGGYDHALTPFVGLGSQTQPVEDPETDYRPRNRASEEPAPLGRDVLFTEDALRLDEYALREIAELYDVEAVAVIVARASGGEDEDAEPRVRAGGTLLDFSGETTRRESLPDVIGRGFDAAAAQIVYERQESWKRINIVRETERRMLEVTFIFDGLRQWRNLQRAVAGASLVDEARLDALSRGGAVMTLTHRGASEQLRTELAQRGARLEEDADLGWTVRASR